MGLALIGHPHRNVREAMAQHLADLHAELAQVKKERDALRLALQRADELINDLRSKTKCACKQKA